MWQPLAEQLDPPIRAQLASQLPDALRAGLDSGKGGGALAARVQRDRLRLNRLRHNPC
ncbi:MAG: hypothetical protein ACRDYX_19020 [Egibacteraceae bacterium]